MSVWLLYLQDICQDGKPKVTTLVTGSVVLQTAAVAGATGRAHCHLGCCNCCLQLLLLMSVLCIASIWLANIFSPLFGITRWLLPLLELVAYGLILTTQLESIFDS